MRKWFEKSRLLAVAVTAMAIMCVAAVTDLVVDENGMCARAVNFINQVKISHALYLNKAAVYNYEDNAVIELVGTVAGTGNLINGSDAKTTPVDADNVAITNSADSHKLNKTTWANVKATLKTYFDGLYQAVMTKAGSADIIAGIDDAKYATAKALYDAGIRGGEWTLIERKTFTAAATSYTFSGLNGDVDRRYRIVMFLKNTYAGESQCTVAFNNDTTQSNYQLERISAVNSTLSSSLDTSNLPYIANASQNYASHGEMEIFGTSGTYRMFNQTTQARVSSGASTLWIFSGAWINTGDNITSFVINCNSPDGIGIGSYIELWKLAQ